MRASKRPLHFYIVLFLLIALLLPAKPTSAADPIRIYVDDDADGGDGLSWENAVQYLQDAIFLAQPGDEIWVAAGVYYPDTSTVIGDTDLPGYSFQLETGVTLYGGFAGTETELSQRNIVANVTILSGDLTQNDADENGIVTDPANIQLGGPNSIHVVNANGVTGSARLDGFTITAGRAGSGNSCPADCGGAIFGDNGAPTLANLTIIGNRAKFGGGIFFLNDSSTPSLTDIVIRNNLAESHGGGLQLQNGADAILNRVQFIDNDAITGGGGAFFNLASPALNSVLFENNEAEYGAGLYNFQNNPSLYNVTFDSNQADYGGGLYNDQSSPRIFNALFRANHAGYGGGMMNHKSVPILVNGSFTGNQATLNGGGIYNNESQPVLTNVTLSGNSTAGEGGAIRSLNSNQLIQNTIIWDNLPNNVSNGVTTSTYRYSLVQGVGPGGTGNFDGTNPLNAPRFVRAVSCGADGCSDDKASGPDESANDDYGDLRLQSASPAIDTGDNAADLDGAGIDSTSIADLPTDVAGQPRVVAAKALPASVDMGAYEAAVFAPVAHAGGPYAVAEGGAIALDASASIDDVSIATYGWDCTNNGTTDASSIAPTGSTCPYPNSGSYTLRLIATDNLSATGIATTTVAVSNIAPSYTPGPNQSTTAGSAKSFALGSFSDPGVEGTWALQIDWGDDTDLLPFTVTSAGALPNRSHSYANPGTYNVAVKVSDDQTDATGSFQVVVNAAPPGAPSVTPPANQAGTTGIEKSFTLGSFTDAGSNGPWSVTIAWGDSTGNTTFSIPTSGELPARPHTFAAAGDYELFVTISDGALSGSATFNITISEAPQAGGAIFLPKVKK